MHKFTITLELISPDMFKSLSFLTPYLINAHLYIISTGPTRYSCETMIFTYMFNFLITASGDISESLKFIVKTTTDLRS